MGQVEPGDAQEELRDQQRRETVRELKRQLREVRAEMKEKGIRRSSFMNGGHSPESYRLNAECFRLETQIKDAERAV